MKDKYPKVALELLGDRASLNEIYIPKIALTGKARSGKSAVSAYLQERYQFTPYAFGKDLKMFADLIFGSDEKSSKKRSLYQNFGQMCRQIHPRIWIDRLFNQIMEDNPEDILVEDLRQPNEFEALKQEGFVIIRINASDDTRKERMLDAGDTFDERDLSHETEQHVDAFAVDYELSNNGKLTDLYEQIDVVMREILRKGSDV